jgi:hypothetical protein
MSSTDVRAIPSWNSAFRAMDLMDFRAAMAIRGTGPKRLWQLVPGLLDESYGLFLRVCWPCLAGVVRAS